jgi:hypothetical protein
MLEDEDWLDTEVGVRRLGFFADMLEAGVDIDSEHFRTDLVVDTDVGTGTDTDSADLTEDVVDIEAEAEAEVVPVAPPLL